MAVNVLSSGYVRVLPGIAVKRAVGVKMGGPSKEGPGLSLVPGLM